MTKNKKKTLKRICPIHNEPVNVGWTSDYGTGLVVGCQRCHWEFQDIVWDIEDPKEKERKVRELEAKMLKGRL